jgi:hypothetical protein
MQSGADADVVRGDRQPSAVVAEALDERGDGVVLNDLVDPDALDALFAPQGDGTERCDGRVTFRYDATRVTVEVEGDEVAVRIE